ncbi:MAG: Arginine N-methyltransferase 2 [Peltula sp. TS41687]|nr:MAG: Arginine N-methyltransferase 2 [Peltula sp. TS41687]
MSWEASIMRRTAELLCRSRMGLCILNIGHGMGIIDVFPDILALIHHIVEAHVGVLDQLRQNGWADRPNDVLQRLLLQQQDDSTSGSSTITTFDVIYFDTFAEDYKALKEFSSEYVIGLLDDDEGRWGFFNGLGADRQICYDVFTKVVEMDLLEAGFDTEWEEVAIPDLVRQGQWDGVRQPYWRARS